MRHDLKMKPFGLLGRKLSHSLSPEIHKYLSDYEYVLFEKEPDELDGFFENREFSGLNVTIPYKKDVIKYCSELSPIAERIGSVNTVTVKKDGTLYGDNSDYFGFSFMLDSSDIDVKGKTVFVLGTGGASLTVKAVLKDKGAGNIVSVSRKGEINYKNISQFAADAQVIVNTTPVGMYPDNGERLIDLNQFVNCTGVLDLIYNPAKTPLLYQAEQLNIPFKNGLTMLVAQAHMSAEKFINGNIPKSEIEPIVSKLSLDRTNIVLIGMPGSGKTTIAKALAQKLKKPVVDTDEFVKETAGCEIPEIFKKHGEGYFRILETDAINKAGKSGGFIIATGGGAVLKEANRYFLKQNGIIIWLKRSVKDLPLDGRPLSTDIIKLRAMEKERLPIYDAAADYCVEVDNDVNITLARISDCIKKAGVIKDENISN